jgi:hypothetical protein
MALGRVDAADARAVRIRSGLRRDHDHRSAARRHLLQVRGGLLEHLVQRGEGHDRRQLVDEGDRPVLQLAGGIALGVDVADLLQLQRPFHGQGEHRPTAEEQHVGSLRHIVRHRLEVVLHQHGLGDQARGLEQGLDQLGLAHGVDPSALKTQRVEWAEARRLELIDRMRKRRGQSYQSGGGWKPMLVSFRG